MRRALFTNLGAGVALFVSYWVVTIFANWYGPRFIDSDSDINDAYGASLLFMLVALILVGFVGFVGFRLSRRREKP